MANNCNYNPPHGGLLDQIGHHHVGSSIVEAPAEFQSDTSISILNLAPSRLREIVREDVVYHIKSPPDSILDMAGDHGE